MSARSTVRGWQRVCRRPAWILIGAFLIGWGLGCGDEDAGPGPFGWGGQGGAVDPVAAFLQEHAHPLDSLAADAPLDDLAPLEQYVQDRPVVMLGEPDHGIVESGQAQLRLVALLYHRLGYSTYATEMGRAVCELAQQYVESGDEALLATLDIFSYPSFANVEETATLFRGLRSLVETRPPEREPLRIRGFDLDHGRFNARDSVLGYLEVAASAELQTALEPLVSCIDVTPACEADQQQALSLLAADEASLVAASSQQQYDDTYDVLRGLGEVLEYYRLQGAGEPGAGQFREDVMMRRMDEILAEAPAGTIVFGHYLHISQYLGRDPGWWTSVGEHLALELGADRVYGLAMFYYQGRHLERVAAGQYEARDVPPAPDGYLESYLQRGGSELLLLDFGASSPGDPGSGWLHAPLETRWNGWSTLPATPVQHWNGALFVERVTPTTPR
jgi:erythromycin esterase-like protein